MATKVSVDPVLKTKLEPIGTVHFEDKGQDFLEWDVAHDTKGRLVVVACRPFQEWAWKGTIMHTALRGHRPIISMKGKRAMVTLNYKITKVSKIKK